MTQEDFEAKVEDILARFEKSVEVMINDSYQDLRIQLMAELDARFEQYETRLLKILVGEQ
jgi:hypothetical protein